MVKQSRNNQRPTMLENTNSSASVIHAAEPAPHFAHLDIELRAEMKGLREDLDKRFDLMREEKAKRLRGSENDGSM